MSIPTPEDLLALLRRFAMERERYVKLLARRGGMGRAEFEALDSIEEAGELTPNQLSERLCLTSGATTALIDRLESAGFLARSPHPTDRRSLILRLTKASDETGARRLSPYMKELDDAAHSLTGEERAAVFKFLERAKEAAIKHAQSESARIKDADTRDSIKKNGG